MTSKDAWAAFAAIGLACCGGIATGDGIDVPRVGEGDSASDGADASDPADALPHDASPPLDVVGDRGDARRNRDGPSIIASGTRFCQDSRECFGLDCEHGQTPGQGSCVAYCVSTDGCDDNELCVAGRTFAASCFARCTSPAHCTVGFDCVDYDKIGERTCLPAPWVIVLPE